MADPINFTIHWTAKTNDVDDHSGDIASAPGIGPVWLIPQFRDESHIPTAVFDPRPTSYYMRAFPGFLDTDGVLKNEAGGDEGMRAWANDPIFELDRLQYRVEASLVDPFGRPLGMRPFYFDAPTEDSIVYLSLEMPKGRQNFYRGRPAFDIIDLDVTLDNEFVFTRADSLELGPVSADASVDILPTATGRALVWALLMDDDD